MSKAFNLDSRLEKDTLFVCRLDLAQIQLSLDANYPWCLLIPEVNGRQEFSDLSQADFLKLQKESLDLQLAMQKLFQPDKLNVAMLGNVVSQLHIHHIARYKNDIAWPGPIWNTTEKRKYSKADLTKRIEQLSAILS